jgi:hypothetical protein
MASLSGLKELARFFKKVARWHAHLLYRNPKSFFPKKKKSFLIFAPEAGLSPHYNLAVVVGKILEEFGCESVLVRCAGNFTRCPVLAAKQMPYQSSWEERRKTCHQCEKEADFIFQKYRIPRINLKEFENYPAPDLSQATIRRLQSHVVDGVKIGSLTAFEAACSLKKIKFEAQDQELKGAWTELIHNAQKSYRMCREILKDKNFSGVIYYGDYSIHLGAALAAERLNKKAYLISHPSHQNVDRRRCLVYQQSSAKNHRKIAGYWARWKNLPVFPDEILDISDDLITRFQGIGSHIYSPPLPPRKTGGVTARRHVVAFTSSPDEFFGGFEMFPSLGLKKPKIESAFGIRGEDIHHRWIRGLTRFASQHPDIFFSVRIHPREGYDKRLRRQSYHLGVLQKKIGELPANFRVIWPEDPLSSYALMMDADLVLTTWSTIGLEAARLGIPVLACTKGISGDIHESFNVIETRPEKYFPKLTELLSAKPSWEKIRKAYRWWNLFCLQNSVPLFDLFPSPMQSRLPDYRSPSNGWMIRDVILRGKNIYEVNRRRHWLSRRRNEPGEWQALKAGTADILFYLVFREKNPAGAAVESGMLRGFPYFQSANHRIFLALPPGVSPTQDWRATVTKAEKRLFQLLVQADKAP